MKLSHTRQEPKLSTPEERFQHFAQTHLYVATAQEASGFTSQIQRLMSDSSWRREKGLEAKARAEAFVQSRKGSFWHLLDEQRGTAGSQKMQTGWASGADVSRLWRFLCCFPLLCLGSLVPLVVLPRRKNFSSRRGFIYLKTFKEGPKDNDNDSVPISFFFDIWFEHHVLQANMCDAHPNHGGPRRVSNCSVSRAARVVARCVKCLEFFPLLAVGPSTQKIHTQFKPKPEARDPQKETEPPT